MGKPLILRDARDGIHKPTKKIKPQRNDITKAIISKLRLTAIAIPAPGLGGIDIAMKCMGGEV